MNVANEFTARLYGKISDENLAVVSQELNIFLADYEVIKKETALATLDEYPRCYQAFMVTKKIEGKSEETLKQYQFQLEHFFDYVRKPVDQIRTEDILLYLYEKQKTMSATSANNVRRVLSSFFGWCSDNGYIEKNPCNPIKNIQGEKNIRKPLSEMQLEKMRDSIDKRKCKYKRDDVAIRDKALFEFMYSTGAREAEVAGCNIDDIDFQTGAVLLFGKGKKQRESYLNTKAKYSLKKYLDMRHDDNPALFVSLNQPHERMSKAGILRAISKYSAQVGDKVYPHKIRHTTATQGLKHGMTLTDMQKLLGHAKPETTLIYAEIADEEVKHSHAKYIT